MSRIHWPDVTNALSGDDASLSRPEMLTTALILLLNAYRCGGCPHLASCIVSHCRSLRAHPDADPMLRQLAAHLELEWCPLAQNGVVKKSH
jgi:hypothetical protein